MFARRLPDIRYRRRIGHCSPRNNQDRAVQEMSNMEKDGGHGWKKSWQIWVSLLTLSSGLVASAWIYFPNNRVVQKSQEYVMTGLLVIIGLLTCTIVLKLIWNSVITGYKSENTAYTWSRNRQSPNHMYNGLSRIPDNVITDTGTPYDSNEMPSYSSPWPNCPVINRQRQMELESPEHTSENMGLSPGHVQLPESNSRENECTDINGTTTEYPNTWCIRGRNVPQSNDNPVRRTFSGARNDVWNEFIQYFENISEFNVWNYEKSRRVLLSTLRGQAEDMHTGCQ
ncbi:NIPA [Mytilus coruscus]|uniref:NIPA n=1 Tax=Mytilus coruscus TaxID=42192 RepID=A0A6J8CKI7_MYTCO|nr:NIPA [Mytilus coruscus]